MTAEFYAGNRQRFLEELPENSVVLLYSGIAPVKSNDQDMHPFSVNRNFYYLTGIDTQNVWLMLAKKSYGIVQTLFIDQPDEFLIKWNGHMLTCEEAAGFSGLAVSDIRYKQDMDRLVGGQIYDGRALSEDKIKVWFSFDRRSMKAAPTAAEEYAKMLKEKYPAIEICNAHPVICMLRTVKLPEEVECIRKAGDTTINALAHMLHTAKPGEYEFQWAADYEHYVARAGMRNAFTTIAASGGNAVMLHYSANNCVTKEGDLFLFDLGAEYAYYSSDVSRTFPISGKYTERQKELYTIVRDAMDVARDNMRPGHLLKDSQQAVIDFYKKALRAAKLITEDSQVERYYYHGVSHSLGLDTHDPNGRTVYVPGMVLSCEPGLYVAEEGIGIRLENDILVTNGEPEDLIGNRLLDINDIENLMA